VSHFTRIPAVPLKSALNTLAKVAPNWLERIVNSDWYDRYGQKDGYLRKTRTYIGLEKTRLQYTLTAAAMNLERIYVCLEEIPLA
jgi:hypothetical protein